MAAFMAGMVGAREGVGSSGSGIESESMEVMLKWGSGSESESEYESGTLDDVASTGSSPIVENLGSQNHILSRL